METSSYRRAVTPLVLTQGKQSLTVYQVEFVWEAAHMQKCKLLLIPNGMISLDARYLSDVLLDLEALLIAFPARHVLTEFVMPEYPDVTIQPSSE